MGYEGNFCEIDRNECVSNPCLNGGKCQDKNDSFACDCSKTGMLVLISSIQRYRFS